MNFEWTTHLNAMLKAPRSDDCYDTLAISQLKMVLRILLWLVSHVLRPKKEGYSRIDIAEVHLVYILMKRIQINWANYFVYWMFALKDCNKGTSFCYVSMIAKILNYFTIKVPNLLFKSLDPVQEFS